MDAKQVELVLMSRCLYVEHPEYKHAVIDNPIDVFWCLITNRELSIEEGTNILNKSRKRDFVIYRQIAHSLSVAYSKKYRRGWSLSKIGVDIGGKDHATCLHSCRSVSTMIDTNDPYLGDISQTLLDLSLNEKDLYYKPKKYAL